MSRDKKPGFICRVKWRPQ